VCSQTDDPSMIDPPGWNAATAPTRPRTYVLSGSVPPARVAASIALAVIGEMLSEAEAISPKPMSLRQVAVDTLREARRRIAEAEAEYADGTVPVEEPGEEPEEEESAPLWGKDGPYVGQVITIAGTSFQTRWNGHSWEPA
jgi:hypothetical protein